MAICNLFVFVSGITFAFFMIGLHNYLTAKEENSCEMTYMFEYPQYVRIPLPENESLEFPKYSLYAYGEGQYTEQLRSMQFRGIPVLFIPGNSGSYRQVRSLASLALRKAKDSRAPFHFNFFAADLNEEHSALFGGVLPEQTRFISKCIHHILQLYKHAKSRPSTVLLFGHSMGGMVAKGVFLEPDFIPGSVHTVLTLATPHTAPVVALDHYVASYYKRVNAFWERGDEKRLLVSVGGGHRDLLVRSGLTLQGNVSALSTAIPAVWVSADHLCILWCKQLVLSLARALFDSVDFHTKQINDDPTVLHRAFSYHLLNRNSGKKVATVVYPKDFFFEKDAEWHEYLRRQFSVVKQDLKNTAFVMVRLMGPQYSNHELIAMEVFGLEARDWVFACTADRVENEIRKCDKGFNLSNMTRFLPSMKFRRKVVYLNLHQLKLQGYTHIVARLPPTNGKVQLNVDVYDSNDRLIEIPGLPHWLSRTPNEFLSMTSAGSLHYLILLPTMEKAWHAATLQLKSTCTNPDQHAVMTLATDWSREDSHAFVIGTVSQDLPLKLHLLRPSSAGKNDIAYVSIHLDPSCSYSVSIWGSLPMVLGQLVRFHAPQLPAYLAAVLLLTLRTQLKGIASGNNCMNFHSALAKGARPYIILPLIKVVTTVLSAQKLSILTQYFPANDWQIMRSQGLDVMILPVLLYLVASFTAYVLAIAIWVAVVVWGTTANKIFVRFISRSIFGGIHVSEWILSAFSKIPTAMAVLLVSLAYATCGAISLAVGLCFYFLLVVKIYQEYLEEQLTFQLRRLTGREMSSTQNPSLSTLHFHSSGLLLWAVIAGLQSPCAIAWAHSFPYSPQLNPDPSFGPALILCIWAPVLWQKSIPRSYLTFHRELDIGLFALAAMCLMFAPMSLYRLGPFVIGALSLVCLQQMLAKSVDPAGPAPPQPAIKLAKDEPSDSTPEPLPSETEKPKQS
ncbi:hypothetical protein B566_EDAN006030 [Ephemera danica]|nr:hypothetical protein B566_EDAN006030 [Ephemera danica]